MLYACRQDIIDVRISSIQAYVGYKKYEDTNVSYWEVPEKDTINYEDCIIVIRAVSFDEYGKPIPANPTKRFLLPIGRISKINVVAHYLDGNNVRKDTITDLLNFTIEYNEYIQRYYKNLENISSKVSEISQIKPYTNNIIILNFSSPPDTTKLQYFVVEYVEEDGRSFVDTTQKVYIK